MTTVTIPKKLTKEGDLVVVPRINYERLLRIAAQATELDRDLDDAIAEYRAGKFFGPFDTAKAGIKFLKSRRSSRVRK